MQLPAERKERIQPATHEPTGITVYFKRLGFIQKTKITGDARQEHGQILVALMQPGVGVQRWEGVEQPDGNEAPYTIANLEAVCEVAPVFGAWFNNQLIDISLRGADPGNVAPPPTEPGTPG